MKMDLITPCKSCPFRTDIEFPLRNARVREILAAIFDRDMTFACHATVDYGREEQKDEDEGEQRPRRSEPGEQHCAGAMILLTKAGRPNQWMRIAARIRAFDPSRLKLDAPVYDSRAAMVARFQQLNRRGKV